MLSSTTSAMKYLALILIACCCLSTASAQTYLGVHSSNYDPMKTALFNPATPATSLMKWEVNLIGIHAKAAQDYLKLTGKFDEFGDFDRDDNVVEKLNGSDKSGNITLDMQGLGFMVNTKKAGAFTFSTRNRTIIDFNNISENFLTSLYNDANNIYNWAASIEDDFIAMNIHSFSEFGIGYSRQAFQSGNHTLTVGGAAKILSPIAAAKLEGSVDINVDEDAETANFGTTDISAISSEIINYADDEDYTFNYSVAGFGLDFGAVYELKTGKGQTKVIGKRKDKQKVRIQPDYFLKAGVAVTDIGWVKHRHSAYSRAFQGNGMNVSLNEITQIEQGDSSFIDFDEVLDATGTWQAFTGDFKTKLPMAITLFADVKLTRGIYVNVSSQINMGSFTSDRPKAKLQNIYSITPRFELPGVGVQMPMAYNPLKGFEMGASIRAGQFVIGSSNIFSWLWSRETSAVDIQFAMAFGGVDKSKKRAVKDLLDEENRWMETGEDAADKKDKKDKKRKKDKDGEELMEE